jgi:hypothetical protein
MSATKLLATLAKTLAAITIVLGVGCQRTTASNFKNEVVTPMRGLPADTDNWSVNEVGKPGIPKLSQESLTIVNSTLAHYPKCRRPYVRFSFGGASPDPKNLLVYDPGEAGVHRPLYENGRVYCVLNPPGGRWFDPTTNHWDIISWSCKVPPCPKVHRPG